MPDIFGHLECKDSNFWKSLTAEFLGTGLLVMVGCGSTTATVVSEVQIALCFGIMVAIMVQCIGHISGGHINPAVTIGMLSAGRISIIRSILYIIVQMVGAIVGAAILSALMGSERRGNLGVTDIPSALNSGQGLGVEIFITFTLVFTVFAVTDDNRSFVKENAPLMIGLSVSACHFWAIKHTGSGMNPARSFGPAVVMNRWRNHWIYWIGPIIGGIAASVVYTFVFSAPKEEKVDEDPSVVQLH